MFSLWHQQTVRK